MVAVQEPQRPSVCEIPILYFLVPPVPAYNYHGYHMTSIGNSFIDAESVITLASTLVNSVGCQRQWDNRGGRKTREMWGEVSSLDEVEYFR